MPAAAAAVAKRPALLPFEKGTRKRFQPLGIFPFVPGVPLQSIVLPQVGFLSRIFLRIEGTITQTAAAATLSVLGYAALISRIRVNANLGSAALVDASATGIELSNFWYAPNIGPLKNTYGNAIAANRVAYGLIIPINANDRTLLQLGMINLQAEQVRVTLDIIPAAIAAYITAGGGVITPALNISVGYEYWDVPNPAKYALPPMTICRILEDNLPLAVVGDSVYPMPRLGTLMQVSEYIILNNALAALTTAAPDVTEFRIRANKTDTWLDYLTPFAEMDEQFHFNTPGGSFLRPGVKTWDFFASGQQPFNFGNRDLINTEQITTLEFIATLAAGAAVGANSSRNIVRRVTQRLA